MIKLIKKTDFWVLDIISWGLPLLLFLGWGFLALTVFHGKAPQGISYLILWFCSFLAGTSGFFQVIKKEVPGAMGRTIKGGWAIISGVILMLLFWGGCILLIYYCFLELIGQIT